MITIYLPTIVASKRQPYVSRIKTKREFTSTFPDYRMSDNWAFLVSNKPLLGRNGKQQLDVDHCDVNVRVGGAYLNYRALKVEC